MTASDLARMKPEALLVKTSRPELIERGALEAALRKSRPAFAAVDVFEEEPILGANHPLLAVDNVISRPILVTWRRTATICTSIRPSIRSCRLPGEGRSMWLLLSSWLLAAVLTSDAQAILESAPYVTVYTLRPEATAREKLDQKKTFHGYRILRRVDVKGEKKSELLGKLYTAIAKQPEPARCFIPRHGIRATSGGRTVGLSAW